jgi:hypothetical protein
MIDVRFADEAVPAERLDGTALLVVDVQPDFLPGGALAVPTAMRSWRRWRSC